MLLGGGAIFLGQVLAQVLALRPHLRIELEGLEIQLHLDAIALQACEGLLQSSQANGAPGAGNVRDEIDLERGHRGMLPQPLASDAKGRKRQKPLGVHRLGPMLIEPGLNRPLLVVLHPPSSQCDQHRLVNTWQLSDAACRFVAADIG